MADIFALIQQRHSVRNYGKYRLTEADGIWIQALFPKLAKIGQGKDIEWKLKTSSPVGSGKLFAPLPDQSPEAYVEYGFEGEALLLKLVSRGFGTCWIAVGRATEKNMPPVIVFGKSAPHSVVSKASRLIIRSNRRKPLEEILSSTSLTPTLDQEKILQAMRLAPSAMNRQPWRFTVKSERSIHVKKLGGHPVWTYVDLGIVLEHGYLATQALTGRADIERLDQDLYAVYC